MKRMQWVIALIAIGAVLLAVGFFGWPKTFEQAGGFATFVAAILTPASLFLVVVSLEKQEAQQKQATRDGFLSLQVQALIALIEDDRAKLDGMTAKYRTTKQKTDAFDSVLRRYQERLAKLNVILGKELNLPEIAERFPQGIDTDSGRKNYAHT